jgi:uncharacterized protein (TIGR03086 family)
MVQHVINELLVHGWDLAKATGQPTAPATDLAEEALLVVHAWFGNPRQTPETWFAPQQPAPPGASAADRLAAYLGRVV